jgi:hypothetical protein
VSALSFAKTNSFALSADNPNNADKSPEASFA